MTTVQHDEEQAKMKRRIAAAGAGVMLALGLGTGLAAAQGTGATPPGAANTPGIGRDLATMNQIHEQMRAQMSPEMRGQCDAMHARMGEMMQSGSAPQHMMGQGTMMGAAPSS